MILRGGHARGVPFASLKRGWGTLVGMGLPSPGDLVASRYRIEAAIGRGAMGVVFRARDPSNQYVAIKVLLPETVATPGAVERFTNEAQAARVLTSEHTVRVFDAGTLDGALPYIVMELLEGADVATILGQRGHLPAAEACDMVIEACDALAEAHTRGLVHRDLKPGNLFAARAPDGRTRMKVLDFGLSKVAAQNRQVALTSTGTILGTPHYMAPEQLRSSKDADARADIWSLGVILYELLTGKEPFDGTSFGMLFSNIVSKEPTPLLSVRPDVPTGLAEIIHRCLKKNRDDRYPKVAELVSALAAFASPAGAAVAKRIVEGPVQRPPAHSQRKLGGTMVMSGAPPAWSGGAPPIPGPAPLPTPPPFTPVAPARISSAPAPQYPVTPQPWRPAAAPPPTPSMAPPSRNVTALVIVLVLFVLAALGIVFYILRARAT
jgi:serine/threonine-protein kinase